MPCQWECCKRSISIKDTARSKVAVFYSIQPLVDKALS